MGRRAGIEVEKLAALSAFEKSPAFDDVEKDVLRLAEAMTRTPVEVPAALFDRLRARFEPRQLVELCSAIAWENYRARFDHAFGIESEGYEEA